MGGNLNRYFPRKQPQLPRSIDVVYDSPEGLKYAWEEEAALETQKEAGEIADILTAKGFKTKLRPVNSDNWQEVLERIDGELVFNMTEEDTLGNQVLAWCEDHNRPVTGANLKGNRLSWDKSRVRKKLERSGLPSPQYRIYRKPVKDRTMKFPAVVKSACDHGSFSVTVESVVKNPDQLYKQTERIIKSIGGSVLAEEYIDGREIQVTVMGNKKLLVFPVKEVIFGEYFKNKPNILTYEAKWKVQSREFADSNVIKCPAEITGKQKRAIESVVTRAFRCLKCRDLARFDIRLTGETPIIVDYNANPDLGLCKIPVEALGLKFEDFIEELVVLAWERRKLKKQFHKSLPEAGEFVTA